jgi:hypothetical protein
MRILEIILTSKNNEMTKVFRFSNIEKKNEVINILRSYPKEILIENETIQIKIKMENEYKLKELYKELII